MKMPFNTEPNFHIRIPKLLLDDVILTPSNMNGENAERTMIWGYIVKNFLAPRKVHRSFTAFAVIDKTQGNRNITSLYSGGKMGSIVLVYFPRWKFKRSLLNEKLAGGKIDL
jgi:hypothetical protein